MKKILISLISGLIVAGCGTGVAGNGKDDSTTTGTNMTTKYSNSASVMLTASVNVTGTGLDTPTDEANEKVSKISGAVVTVSDAAAKVVDTIKLKTAVPSIKGEIFKFESGFIGIPKGQVKLKFDFNDSAGKTLFSTEGSTELKAKTVFNIAGNLEQVSIKKDPGAVESFKVDIKEMAETSYTKGEILASLKEEITEGNLKTLLEQNGIKVTSLKKSVLKAYNVQFSSPSVAEALILANQTGKFEYVEPNGFVSIQ